MSESLNPVPAEQAWHSSIPPARWQAAVGAGVVLVAVGMGVGASQITGDAGYGGVGPSFLPWLCAVVLALCGAWLVWEATDQVGYRKAGEPGGSAKADVGPFVWVSAGPAAQCRPDRAPGLHHQLHAVLHPGRARPAGARARRSTLSGKALLKDVWWASRSRPRCSGLSHRSWPSTCQV